MEIKSFNFDIKAISQEGIFEGYASTFGNIDRMGDIVVKGAFLESIPEFLKNGVICWQHDWSIPIGVPTYAAEDNFGLYVKGKISDTQAGRECRTLMIDKVIKKLSIGFGTELYDNLTAQNIETYLTNYEDADESDIQKAVNGGRALIKLDLLEFSPVSIPANELADITFAKGASLAGVTFDNHSDKVLAACKEYITRITEIRDIRKKDGRELSEANRTRLRVICDSLLSAHTEMIDLLESTVKPQKNLHLIELQALRNKITIQNLLDDLSKGDN